MDNTEKVREILCELLDTEKRAEALRWDLRKFGRGGGELVSSFRGCVHYTYYAYTHFYGQALTDAGRPEASVQQGLRHANPTMTRRYTKRRDQGENARQMDEIMFPKLLDKGRNRDVK